MLVDSGRGSIMIRGLLFESSLELLVDKGFASGWASYSSPARKYLRRVD